MKTVALHTILHVVACTVMCMFCLSPAMLYAQSDAVYKGDVLRITFSLHSPEDPVSFDQSFTGIFTDYRDDSLFIQVESEPFSIHRSHILKIDVVRDETYNTWRGALLGGSVGGLGLALFLATDAIGNNEDVATSSRAGLLVGALAGASIGSVVGSLSKSVVWEQVDVEALALEERPLQQPAEEIDEKKEAYIWNKSNRAWIGVELHDPGYGGVDFGLRIGKDVLLADGERNALAVGLHPAITGGPSCVTIECRAFVNVAFLRCEGGLGYTRFFTASSYTEFEGRSVINTYTNERNALRHDLFLRYAFAVLIRNVRFEYFLAKQISPSMYKETQLPSFQPSTSRAGPLKLSMTGVALAVPIDLILSL